ncbi:hypothetical protein [Pseudomonas sp. PA27(2017)]|uniref:hypothetical protein n=1 Tax=Pseudomonas sp. PA27(2017) TaxID=1932112 RepID=UPI000959CC8F|nr:hypothetical protein [Pseudomonas sp. PA27(2017)]OLU30649.1 hypothetical protein BVH06_15580 [Pseudomonas sp. PA27(2017)]
MLLKRLNAPIPFLTFVVVSIGFWVIQFRYFDLIGWNYSVCHWLFGFTFPFFLSYLSVPCGRVQMTPLTEVLKRILAVPFYTWPLALLRVAYRSTVRDLNEGLPWNPWVGASITLAFSMGNEMFVDPTMNGIPFVHAYDHFLADVLGITCFLLVTMRWVHRAREHAVSE